VREPLWVDPVGVDDAGGDAFVAQMRRFGQVGVEEVHVMPMTDDPAGFVRGLGDHVVPHLAAL